MAPKVASVEVGDAPSKVLWRFLDTDYGHHAQVAHLAD